VDLGLVKDKGKVPHDGGVTFVVVESRDLELMLLSDFLLPPAE
jgi:hypothetical protein